jgi:hypothetical protein
MRRSQTQSDPWDYVINTIYKETPASISIIEGDWKTGKTDFALHLAVDELRDRRHLVSRVASNIRCFEDQECRIPNSSRVEYIDNFDLLRLFISKPGRKVFIYDEALKNTPSKRAMTTLNAEWLKVVPELSKGGDRNNPGGCHLFVLTQEDSLTEKLFLHPTFKTAKWKKVRLHPMNSQFRKLVRLSSKLLKRKTTFRNLPATTVNFNPYLSASWSLHPTEKDIGTYPLELQVVMEYAKGFSTDLIVKKHPELRDRKEVTRKLRKGMLSILGQWQVADATRREAVPEPLATTSPSN